MRQIRNIPSESPIDCFLEGLTCTGLIPTGSGVGQEGVSIRIRVCAGRCGGFGGGGGDYGDYVCNFRDKFELDRGPVNELEVQQ